MEQDSDHTLAWRKAVATLERGGVKPDVGPYDADLVEEAVLAKGRVGPEVRCCAGHGNLEPATLISLRTEAEELVGFCAVKSCAMRGRGLERYLFDSYREHYSGGRAPFRSGLMPEFVGFVQGDVAYIGDLWLKPTQRLDISAFAIIAQAVAHRVHGAEWSYFFTRERNAMRGLAARYFAARAVPRAVRWLTPVEHRRDDDWLFVTRRDEYLRIEGLYAAEPEHVSGSISAARPSLTPAHV